MGTHVPRCSTKGCTRACGTTGDYMYPQQFLAYCSADCMVSRGARTDSEGGPCANKACGNSREPDGRGGYAQHCSKECREGRGGAKGVRFEEEANDGAAMDDLAKLFPTMG